MPVAHALGSFHVIEAMPAAARRHPQPEELLPAPVASDWEQLAPLVDRFTDQRDDEQRAKRKQKLRRHKRFFVSAPFIVSTLLTLELVALVGLYALDLRTIRTSNQLDRDIKETSLQIALTQDALAAQNAALRLNQWAQELGFQKAAPHDMDDVTGDAPMPVAKPKVR